MRVSDGARQGTSQESSRDIILGLNQDGADFMKALSRLQVRWKFSVVNCLIKGGAITVTGCFVFTTSGNYAWSQVTNDNTLGNENSLVTSSRPDSFQINGGATRGTNLFHSFSEFSIPTGGSVYFNNLLTIKNIISRVTGSSVSNIDGLIRANGTANLFLINPNGIIFGSNASLEIGGSLIGSTASSLNFADGIQFSTTASQTPPLLTISVPWGLQYGGNAGSIQVQNSTLQVSNGKTLALVGGNLSLDGASLQTLGGRVELGGVAGIGTVALSSDSNNLRLSFPLDLALADISLTNGAQVNVRAGGGGSIALNAQTLKMAGESRLQAGIDTGLGSIDSIAGNIEIRATGIINLTDGSIISNSVLEEGLGKGGDINITTGSLSLTNGALLSADTYGTGDAGNVNINARDTVSFDGAYVSSDVNKGASGNGGSINITTGSLLVSNDTFLTAETYGTGHAGNVNINAHDTVSFDGSTVFSDVNEGAIGKGGSINITTGSLFVSNGALLSVDTYGTGDAGSVNINARDSVYFDDPYVSSDVHKGAIGNGGSINITTGSLFVSNGALLTVDTYGSGDAGSVNINARNTVSFDGAYAFSDVNQGASGNGGSINITTGSLFFSNDARLSVDTYGSGNAGSVNINARDTVSFDGSTAYSDVNEGAIAKGGSINITTGSLFVSNGALLGTSTFGTGDAGRVNINARDTVSFDGVDSNGLHSSAFSFVGEEAIGNGGSINITTGSLFVSNGALLSTSTFGTGDAGSVNINARDTVSFDRSNAFSLVRKGAIGNGGSINITTGSLSVSNGALLGTSTYGKGDAGSVNINSRDTVSFDGAYAFSDVNERAIGNGGSINITTGSLFVSNGAGLSASSRGNSVAGNIEVAARSIRLDNQGAIIAATSSADGGNIRLRVQDLLLMRHGSQISTTAGTAQAGGDGGNITIDADFIVAVPKENSDITANAFRGRGGNINITTQGIYGLQFRPRLTPLSDITASSEFGLNGNVQINTPDVDPSRGLAELPVEPVNLEVAQGCQSGGQPSSVAFFHTGRGGLAPNPYEPINSSGIWEDVPSPTQKADTSAGTARVAGESVSRSHKLVEAQGWLINEQGEVTLVAQMPTTASKRRCRLR